ncbi:MAG TPA: TonB-dependent receptor [Rickettsiales bacterium]|nr:TonB-dependent receptor [Rickettsiales bacterium]
MAVILAAAGMHCEAYAEAPIDDFNLSPEELFDAKVISVSKAPERVMDAPAAVYVLTNEDIIRSGATSIPEALRLVPGVQVAQINANSWAVSVRGFNSALANKLLVLVDGRTVYDPLFSGVHWNAQNMVLEDIERIEVVRGPGASLWGANAVNGVINIITKKAKDTQGNLASVTAGNKERGTVEDRFGGAIGENGEKGYYRIYGKYRSVADDKTPSGADAHDGMTDSRAGFRADLNGSSSRDNFTVQGDIFRNEASDYRTTPLLVAPYGLTQIENLNEDGANILGRWNRTFADKSTFMLQSYVDYFTQSQEIINDRRTTFDVEAQYDLAPIGRHAITIGGDYRYSADDLSSSSSFISYPGAFEGTTIFSGFLQDKITLVPKSWFLTLGSKIEHNDYTGVEVEPNARLQWFPDDNQMAWASVSRAVRTPSRLEHDLTINEFTIPPRAPSTTPIDLILRANPDFASEDLVAYEIGYRRQITPELSTDIAAFYNDYSNLETNTLMPFSVGSSPTHIIFPFEFTNDTSGETHGIELLTDWRAQKNLKLSASYSLLQVDLHGPPSSKAISSQQADTQSPTSQFNATSRWDVTSNTSFDTTLYYTSELPYYKIPHYWRLDARYSWRIMDGLQFSLTGQNLLMSSHREFSSATDVSAAEIPRSIFGSITWRY